MCCAWSADELIRTGYRAEDRSTGEIVRRWREASPEACLVSNSVKYLRRTGQLEDLDFVLSHINDVHSAFLLCDGEVVCEHTVSQATELPQYGEVAA